MQTVIIITAALVSAMFIFSLIFLVAPSVACYFFPATKTKPVETKPMTKTMQVELDALIAETKGKFFSITFVKKDGTTRVINGKDKYQRLLKGGSDTVRQAGYVPFVNRNTETWASAHKDAVVTFRCGSLVKEIAQ